MESLQRDEKVAFAAALAKQSETSTSQGVRFADKEAVDRNDSIETQPSLKSSLGLDASVSASFKFKGIVDEDGPSPHLDLNSAEKGKGSEAGKGALEDIDIQAEGNDPQENEVIKLEERAPPIAEEEADPDTGREGGPESRADRTFGLGLRPGRVSLDSFPGHGFKKLRL